jgi:hypothetical protein
MSKYSNGNPNVALLNEEATFYDQVLLAEQTWQSAVKTTQAQTKAADIARHRSIVTAAAAAGNTINAGHLAGPSRQALRELTGGV